MAKPPERHEPEPPPLPQRAAGITPAAGVESALPARGTL
jgi:cytochrome d ubiquinol oxidase subunit I